MIGDMTLFDRRPAKMTPKCFYDPPSTFTGRRGVIFVVVVLLHLVMGYIFMIGLGARIVQSVIPPIIVQQIEERRVEKKIEPLVSPQVERVAVYVPVPEFVDVTVPVENNAITVQSVSPAPPAPAPVVERVEVVRTGVRADPNNPLHIGEEYYPDASKRLGEEGACLVHLQVKADGYIVDPTIVRTSGFPRLDDACLKGVIGQKMYPATENGKPVDSVTTIRIHWALRNNR